MKKKSSIYQYFFLKHAGELRIISLRREKKLYKGEGMEYKLLVPTHTHTHTPRDD